MMSGTQQTYIRWFSTLTKEDVKLVGGKNASLGEMYSKLTNEGITIPNGFAITADAYKYMLNESNGWEKLHDALDLINTNNLEDFSTRAQQARDVVYNATIPNDLCVQILKAYEELKKQYGTHITVAVRSSATAEDLPTASFAGQQDSFLHISSEEDLIDACKRCFASLFTDRAIHYRIDQKFDHFKLALSIGIQKMVRSDLAASGVMFTLDTESGFRDVVFITASYGLGETIVQGSVDPDEYYVHKPTFNLGYRAVLRRQLGSKKIKLVYSKRRPTRMTVTSLLERQHFCLTEADVLTLAEYAIKIENHYKIPMDIEFGKDGEDGKIYIVQARPETVISQRVGPKGVGADTALEQYELTSALPPVITTAAEKRTGGGMTAVEKTVETEKEIALSAQTAAQAEGQQQQKVVTGPIAPVLLLTGHAIGSKIAHGTVRVVNDVSELPLFQPGEVLVAENTTPDWEPVMKIASAIVTNRGGRTCHSAIVSRELGLPAVVGTEFATDLLKNGDEVTICCHTGEQGEVYRGLLNYKVTRTSLDQLKKPLYTKVMINLGNPAAAFRYSFLPVEGVGLARMEFIISEHIKIHPMALLYPEKVTDITTLEHMKALVRSYDSPTDYFIKVLAEGVAMIAAAFYPRPVIVRLSDFKSNEYMSLLGGKYFEVQEENPMIGFRGASRYTHPAYKEAFALECQAMKYVREIIGLGNVQLMVPFCRTVTEAKAVLAYMKECGLESSSCGISAATAAGSSTAIGTTTGGKSDISGTSSGSGVVSSGMASSNMKGEPQKSTTATTTREELNLSSRSLTPSLSDPPVTTTTSSNTNDMMVANDDEKLKLLKQQEQQAAFPLKILMMCEIPNNVLCLDEFLNYYDGISIGSNDLTQLTLGVDRDSSVLAPLFDEREEGVQKLIESAIQGVHDKNQVLWEYEMGKTMDSAKTIPFGFRSTSADTLHTLDDKSKWKGISTTSTTMDTVEEGDMSTTSTTNNIDAKYCGICGQAPSDYPEFTQFLVECGIESISVNPDVALKTMMIVTAAEEKKRMKNEEVKEAEKEVYESRHGMSMDTSTFD